MRKIPKKNYFIFLGLVVVTIVLTLYLGKWYKTTTEYKNNISPLASSIKKITIDELDSYLLDNPDALVYITDNDKNYDYEKELKKIIETYDLENYIVYLEINDSDYQKITNYYYNSKLEINNLVIFDDNKIKYFVAHDESDLTSDNTIDFLKEHKVIEE